VKKPVLSCQSCGDCAIQHVAFLCPESGCPKHTRNGACGGSRDGFCEVNPDRECVWVRAYKRLNQCNMAHTLAKDFVPPRMWELNNTSSWINFHLGKDHQKKK
jgi:methylenetetrahydrofolate reductase (NADPH)